MLKDLFELVIAMNCSSAKWLLTWIFVLFHGIALLHELRWKGRGFIYLCKSWSFVDSNLASCPLTQSPLPHWPSLEVIHARSLPSVQFSRSVVSDTFRPHEPQHSRPPCPSPTPGVYPKHLILCCPLLLLPSIFPSIRVFSDESALRIRWPKYWSFSLNISPSSEHPGLIFRMDWLDLLAVQGTLKSLLQHHSSKASILLCSAFFIVLLSHPYMTNGKTLALTRLTFVDKVLSLLFNILSRLVIPATLFGV